VLSPKKGRCLPAAPPSALCLCHLHPSHLSSLLKFVLPLLLAASDIKNMTARRLEHGSCLHDQSRKEQVDIVLSATREKVWS
jgi:hypothetical protein